MAKTPTASVLMFPGSNCELETKAAFERNGFTAQIVRWNEPEKLTNSDAIAIVGGFSYEDRGRSGLIASRDPVMKKVFEEAQKGALVLGICNGAQILVESGLVPHFTLGASSVALARNHREVDNEKQGEGYYNSWVHIMPTNPNSSAFDRFTGALRVPVAHGEGRFVFSDGFANIRGFVYAHPDGTPATSYPAVPNGSEGGFAGIMNSAGTVLALMPHPERTELGDALITSMRDYLEKVGKKPVPAGTASPLPVTLASYAPAPSEFFIRLTITDNEAISMEQALSRANLSLRLTKYRYVPTSDSLTLAEASKLASSGTIANPEKESIVFRASGKSYRYDKSSGFVPYDFNLPVSSVLSREKGDEAGAVWASPDADPKIFDTAVKLGYFHHVASSTLAKIS